MHEEERLDSIPGSSLFVLSNHSDFGVYNEMFPTQASGSKSLRMDVSTHKVIIGGLSLAKAGLNKCNDSAFQRHFAKVGLWM